MFDINSPLPPARNLDGAYFVDANPDIFEDLELFDKLGIQLSTPFEKHAQPETKESVDYASEEKVKWSRPAHKIERNEEYKALAKEKRAALKK